jgi:hypothetical protein
MPLLALLLRLVFTLGAALIVLTATVDAWQSGAPLLALAAFVFFPLTYFIYPWISGLQVVWLVSLVAFGAGNAIGARTDRR